MTCFCLSNFPVWGLIFVVSFWTCLTKCSSVRRILALDLFDIRLKSCLHRQPLPNKGITNGLCTVTSGYYSSPYRMAHSITIVQHGTRPASWQSCNHQCFVFGRSHAQISVRRSAILTKYFRDFPQSLQKMPGYNLKLGNNTFLSNSFQFIVHFPGDRKAGAWSWPLTFI
jgi:hypothetical protein